MSLTIFICLTGVVTFVSTQSNGGIRCGSTEFACSNGRCIPNQWLCDHEDDCKDNSDESECEHPTCAEDEFTCKNSTDCFPVLWKCDGERDCADGSDEVNCANVTVACAPNQFSCGATDKTCIIDSFVCDGHQDCASGLDESNITCFNRKCQDDEYQCKSDKRCISKRWLCDHDLDCIDGSDESAEQNCPQEQCEPNQWMCGSKHCIPAQWRCDGSIDCSDKSDELNCTTTPRPPSHCSADEFYCKISRECIHRAWVCDADRDCDDETDEEECAHLTCPPDQFQCARGHCLLKHLACDGIDHCGDNSDEDHCKYECDAHTEFDCSDAGDDRHDCISVNLLCNNVSNCKDRKDEDEEICQHDFSDGCQRNNGGCSHGCLAHRLGVFCTCPSGYQLAHDDKTCEDIDECAEQGYCSQICHNSIGGFKCGCHAGYELDLEDRSTCRVEGGEPILLFSNRRDLRQMHLYSGHYRSLLDDVRNAIAIDYDIKNRMLFLSDVSMENISRVNFNESGTLVSNEVIVSEDISIPDGLAFDWIHRNIYWTDTGSNRIEVMSLGGTKTPLSRRTLINSELDEPRAIVVDPREKHRAVYWTDWGSAPKIESSKLDGSLRKQVVTSGIEWPNGLTIDYKSNRLFWVDAKLHIIASSDFEGQNRLVVLTSFAYLAHPFAIAVFENDVYWSDWQAQSILKINKNPNHGNVTTVIRDLMSPMDLHIYHTLTQPEGVNICDNQCSHLCLPRTASPGYTCACPSDTPTTKYSLDSEGKTCIANALKKTGDKIKIDKDDSIKNSGSGANHDEGVKDTKESEKKMSSEKSVGDFNKRGNWKIAVAVSLSAFAVAVIVLIVVLFIRHVHHKRNIKTMNFDNPVYRKTTECEEQFSLNKHLNRPVQKQVSTVLEPLNSTNEYV